MDFIYPELKFLIFFGKYVRNKLYHREWNNEKLFVVSTLTVFMSSYFADSYVLCHVILKPSLYMFIIEGFKLMQTYALLHRLYFVCGIYAK